MYLYPNHPRSLVHLRRPVSSSMPPPVLPPPISITQAMEIDEADYRSAFPDSQPVIPSPEISFSLSPGSSNQEGIAMGLREPEPSSPVEISINGEDPVQVSLDELADLVESDPLADVQIVSTRTISAAEFNQELLSSDDEDPPRDEEILLSDDDQFVVLNVASEAPQDGAADSNSVQAELSDANEP